MQLSAVVSIPEIGKWVQTPNGIAQVTARKRNPQTGQSWLFFGEEFYPPEICRPLPARMPREWLEDVLSMVSSCKHDEEAARAIKAVLAEAYPCPDYKRQIWDVLSPEQKNSLKGARS